MENVEGTVKVATLCELVSYAAAGTQTVAEGNVGCLLWDENAGVGGLAKVRLTCVKGCVSILRGIGMRSVP